MKSGSSIRKRSGGSSGVSCCGDNIVNLRGVPPWISIGVGIGIGIEDKRFNGHEKTMAEERIQTSFKFFCTALLTRLLAAGAAMAEPEGH